MVKFQGLTAAAGAMLSPQAQGSTRDQQLALTLLQAMGADSLVPRGPEPVMGRVANAPWRTNGSMWCGLPVFSAEVTGFTSLQNH